MFFDYWRQHQLPIKVARIFNTYGPRTHPNDGRVVSSFIVQALRNQDITLFGDGEQTRSFCYVDDLIRGLLALMETKPQIVGPINLGNPTEFTMRQLAELILELTDFAPKSCIERCRKMTHVKGDRTSAKRRGFLAGSQLSR